MKFNGDALAASKHATMGHRHHIAIQTFRGKKALRWNNVPWNCPLGTRARAHISRKSQERQLARMRRSIIVPLSKKANSRPASILALSGAALSALSKCPASPRSDWNAHCASKRTSSSGRSLLPPSIFMAATKQPSSHYQSPRRPRPRRRNPETCEAWPCPSRAFPKSALMQPPAPVMDDGFASREACKLRLPHSARQDG